MKKTHIITIISLLLTSNVAQAQHTNILISDQYNTNEPSIVINHKNPDHIVAGANLDNFYYSTDGGYNWQEYKVTSQWGVWGDPCFAVDSAGKYYYFHLSNAPSGSWIDRIVCQRLDSISSKS